MPLFGSKFSPKKPPSRKSSASTAATGENLDEKMVTEDRAVRLKLGEQETIFKDGEWIPGEFHVFLVVFVYFVFLQSQVVGVPLEG